MFLGCRYGLATRSGQHARPGFLLRARNSRYLPGDLDRLWALLGRAKFNAASIPAAAAPASDDATVKAIFTWTREGYTPKLVVHKGGSLFEATLGASGAFSEAKAISTAVTARGTAIGYKNKVYYPCGGNGFSSDLHFWVREASGWVKGGHRTPTAAFTAANQGSGTFASTTDVIYTYRIYDATTGTESAAGPFVTKALFNTILAVRLTFTNGVTVNGERGTHLRIYRTYLSEPAGVFYRIDGSGDGIPLASVVPGYTFDDSVSNRTSAIYGRVAADGEEGSFTWAEYGGAPPRAYGGLIFSNHLVLWGIYGDESRIYYSAQGLPECFPVNLDGEYQYYLTFSTSKIDKVMCCAKAGPYLLVFNENSIFRVLVLPTYAEAGFNRRIEDTLTSDHGICSRHAVASFGIGPEESSFAVYVSREHGPMLTNGVADQPLVDQADWLELVEPAYLGNTVVRNYASRQEVWVGYTPKGGSRNTQALIIDYSAMKATGPRVTGPVDVQMDDAVYDTCPDGQQRFFLASAAAATVYVQDSGSTDAQGNTNAAGDIRLEWDFPRARLGGDSFSTRFAKRLSIEGGSGTQKAVVVSIRTRHGRAFEESVDTGSIGPGETEDFAIAETAGSAHSALVTYIGPTGSNYDEEDSACAPHIRGVRWELGAAGVQRRTS